MVTVVDLDDESVTVDGNHPLAGKVLNFDLEIIEVRDASSDEIEHGHVHHDGAPCQTH
ncbi:MAG: peptidylprolyl isomerase, partial [Sedimenticola sp.]|nr:peptidylprolyl isomerase [Sedimenticola sp.]